MASVVTMLRTRIRREKGVEKPFGGSNGIFDLNIGAKVREAARYGRPNKVIIAR